MESRLASLKILHQSNPHTCVLLYCVCLPSGQLPAAVEETLAPLLVFALLLLSVGVFTPLSAKERNRTSSLYRFKNTR